jgi:hypothetical protein
MRANVFRIAPESGLAQFDRHFAFVPKPEVRNGQRFISARSKAAKEKPPEGCGAWSSSPSGRLSSMESVEHKERAA